MAITLIAALDNNYAIGKHGQMPWHLPDELAYFKSITQGKIVLMGYTTAVAIGKALPSRENLVLSRQHDAPFASQRSVRSLDEAREIAAGRDLMVIGGGQIFKLALPYALHLYLTWVDVAVEGADTFFPSVNFHQWVETSRDKHPKDDRHVYAFEMTRYVRE